MIVEKDIDPVEVRFVARCNHLLAISRDQTEAIDFEQLSKLHQEQYLNAALDEFRKSRSETHEMQQRLGLFDLQEIT